jgi:glycosyltransferase involved in cell wall biosynthesis
MKGLLIWAHSMCRSMAFLYRELSVQLNVPLKVCVAYFEIDDRGELGFSHAEFEGIDYELVGNNPKYALKILDSYKEYHQIFAVYHNAGAFRKAFYRAHQLGCPIAVFSEAPINMEDRLARCHLKNIYNRFVLPGRVRKYTRGASYFVNLSGDESRGLRQLGWEPSKIVPSGYYPPPIVGSRLEKRSKTHYDDFHILCTGPVKHIRGTHVLIEACRILRIYHQKFRVTVTQDGPLRKALEAEVEQHGLPVDFLGIVPLDKLTKLYGECSCFVACGLTEPWGIRVNDALNCGAPVVVSDGMGVKKLVNEFCCGRTFRAGDAVALASVLFQLIDDREAYLRVSDAAAGAMERISPKAESARLIYRIRSLLPEWLN